MSERDIHPDDVLRELGEYRASIDNLDAAMIRLLAERFRVTLRVGELKHQHKLPPADPAREEHQMRRLKEIARDAGLDPEVVELVLPPLMAEVRRRHRELGKSASGTS
ncbi:chorismate mutase [Alkalispirochaeta alkalica]|uniref:chorismate mutase n=1 Tax=Alkalispirochaeta alkalica TaxID=46356 RepID=UPI000372F7E8|nr:chorismate mutase [Alkalispirochaeta alkalica]